MYQRLIFLILLFLPNLIFAQFNHKRVDSISVTASGKRLAFPFAGGFNNPQFSEIDLNGDGIKDLFVFDRDGNVIKTFINQGIANQTNYVYAPEYQKLFPKNLEHYVLLVDYDCDGKADIFTATRGFAGGIRVFKNTYSPGIGLNFKLTYSILNSDDGTGIPSSLTCPSADISSFIDVDSDGDLDVLTFGSSSSLVQYHQNQAIEMYGRCDTLVYILKDNCWGNFVENSTDNSVRLNTCSPRLQGIHSGSTLLAIDMDNDQDKELILGDISFRNMVYLTNGGNKDTAKMVAYDSIFPSNSLSVDVNLFPAGFLIDVDNDSLQDLLVSPNVANISENKNSVWYYKNSGTKQFPSFTFQQNNLFQAEMIEVGTDANVALFDENGDGLLDIIVGNDGVLASTGLFVSSLSLYRNIGTKRKPAFEFITDDYLSLKSQNFRGLYPCFGDLDNDGDDDMILGDFDGKIHYYKNNANGSPIAAFVQEQLNYKGIDIGQYAVPNIVDINRDGKPDLVIGEKSGNLNFYENIGSSIVPNFNPGPTNNNLGNVDTQIPCCGGYSVPNFVDSNNNYKLFLGSEQGYIYIYNNIDGNLTGNFNLVDSFFIENIRASVATGDLNNDGRLDFVSGEHTGGIAIYLNQSSVGLPRIPFEKINAKIFPNPSHGIFEIKIQDSRVLDYNVLVFNVLGEKVLEKNFTGFRNNIHLSKNAKGIYFLEISSEKGIYYEKLILN